MKLRTPLAVILIVSCLPVYAGKYSDAAMVESYCSSIGESAATYYQARVSGVTKAESVDLVKQHHGENPPKMDRIPVIVAYDLATDARDAYKKAWAYCMDNVRIVNESGKKNR